MRYRIRLIVEIICKLRGYTATDSIRLLLLLPFVAIISFIAKRINSVRKAILRRYSDVKASRISRGLCEVYAISKSNK
jgi:hypothetical protein